MNCGGVNIVGLRIELGNISQRSSLTMSLSSEIDITVSLSMDSSLSWPGTHLSFSILLGAICRDRFESRAGPRHDSISH